MLTNAGAHPNGIGILLLRFPAKAHSHVSREIPTAQEARGVAEEAGKELKKLQADVHTVLISATPGIEEAVLQGLQLALPNVKIIGATAADETLSGEWRVLGESAMPCGLSAVAFGAGARVGTACVAPYERTDGMEEGVVTEADGRVIKMVNGKRAADVLSMWLPGVDMAWKEGGSDVTVACARQPVGLVRAGGDEWTGLHLAEVYADGSIRAFAKVESGDRVVKLQNVDGMECSDAIARGVGVAYEKALEDGNMKDAKGGVLVYCGGIGMAVGEGIDDSLRELGEKEAKVMGVTAFGEQGVCDGVFAQYNLSLGMALFG